MQPSSASQSLKTLGISRTLKLLLSRKRLAKHLPSFTQVLHANEPQFFTRFGEEEEAIA